MPGAFWASRCSSLPKPADRTVRPSRRASRVMALRDNRGGAYAAVADSVRVRGCARGWERRGQRLCLWGIHEAAGGAIRLESRRIVKRDRLVRTVFRGFPAARWAADRQGGCPPSAVGCHLPLRSERRRRRIDRRPVLVPTAYRAHGHHRRSAEPDWVCQVDIELLRHATRLGDWHRRERSGPGYRAGAGLRAMAHWPLRVARGVWGPGCRHHWLAGPVVFRVVREPPNFNRP